MKKETLVVVSLFVTIALHAQNYEWAKSFGGSGFDTAEQVSSIRVDDLGNVYAIGQYEGTADFDPGPGTANLSSSGLFDVFVQKISQGTVGVVGINDGLHVSVYPNPSIGLVQVEFEQALSGVDITLTDVGGRIVYTKQLDTALSSPIQITGPAGVYFLTIKMAQGQKVVKLIKN
ncbi:MAG: T9SS type A sorting domain-containing protein [Bacteroidota bacterium]